MLQLYSNIKARRLALHMTQSELAEKMGYSGKSMIAKIEAGQIDIPQSKILRFAQVLEVSPGDLMGWDAPTATQTAPEPPETPSMVKDTLTTRETAVVTKYRRLDDLDKGKIDERMDTLLEDEKYKKESLDVREIS